MADDRIKVTLSADGVPDTKLLLREHDSKNTAPYNSRTTDRANAVRSDLTYTLLMDPGDVCLANARLYINDILHNCRITAEDNCFRLTPVPSTERIFENCFGTAQLSLELDWTAPVTDALNTTVYNSELLPVMLAQGDTETESMQQMLDYVWEHAPELLFEGERSSRASASPERNGVATLESALYLTRLIIDEYTRSYPFFRTNARTTMREVPEVQGFDRLRRIEPNTLHYIAAHPEHLIPAASSAAIQVNSRRYTPQKTLIMHRQPSTDVYENRVVVGFIDLLCHTLEQIRSQLGRMLAVGASPQKTHDGYAAAEDTASRIPRRTVRRMLGLTETLIAAARRVLHMYRGIMDTTSDPRPDFPRPTDTFLRVQEYSRIFRLIHEWRSYGVQELGKGPLVVAVARTPDIYEHYLTVRMRQHFLETGWELRQNSRMKYMFAGSSEGHHLGRVLHFERDGYTLRLYVQPLINGGAVVPHDTGCGLYRNTSLRLSGAPVSDPRNMYYTPDFVLSLTGHGVEKYMIMDAKFRKWSSVQFDAADLVFRYLVSLTPYNPDASVHGLAVFCGKGEATPGVHSLYDLAPDGHSPDPKASWLYLTELDSPAAQRAKLSEVFRGFLPDTSN